MDLFSLQSLFLVFPIFISLYFFFHNHNSSNNELLRNYPLLGNLPGLFQNRHRFFDWTTDILSRSPTNTFVFHRPGKLQGIITSNPLNVEHILKTNFHNYPKGDRFVFFLQDFLGTGILNSDGDLWKSQRKTASFEFNTRSLRNFVMENVRQEIQSRLIPLLIKAKEMNHVIDLQDILERFAFDNICKVVFNVDPACLDDNETAEGIGGKFLLALGDAATLSAGRFMYPFPFLWQIMKKFNIGSEKRLRESISIIHDFTDKIIRLRTEKMVEKQEYDDDLLSQFISNYSNFTDFLSLNFTDFLRDIAISFVSAGRDTTSSALTWFFWLLASKPDIQRKILDELHTIRKRNGKNIGDTYDLEELRQMHYLHGAISETLRLYPPVAFNTRACLKDDVMADGTVVREGWFVSYNAYAMGRMESIWGKNCREFVPERWLENGMFRPENPFRFPVFHAGPRMCLGKDMAYIQMKSIAASVLERFMMDAVDKDTCPEHLLSITLRMKGGLRVRVKERCVEKIG